MCRLQVDSITTNLNHKILNLLTKWRCPVHTQSYHRLSTDTKSSFSFSKICFTKVIKRWVRWYSKMVSFSLQRGLLSPHCPHRLTVEVLDSEGAEEWKRFLSTMYFLNFLNFIWHFFFFSFFLIFNVAMVCVSLPVIPSTLAPTAKGLAKNLRPSRSAAEIMRPGRRTFSVRKRGWVSDLCFQGKTISRVWNWVGFDVGLELGGGVLKAETRILSCQRRGHFEAWIDYSESAERDMMGRRDRLDCYPSLDRPTTPSNSHSNICIFYCLPLVKGIHRDHRNIPKHCYVGVHICHKSR